MATVLKPTRFAKLKIICPTVDGHSARAWLNDQEISRFISAIDVSIRSDYPNKATLTIWIDELEMDVETEAVVKQFVVEEDKPAAGEGD